MPWSPKPRCRICGRIGCLEHKRTPRPRTTETKDRRPEYGTSQERKRRAATVQAFMSEHGITLPNGDVIARCPQCHQMRAHFVADHSQPIALGGKEGGVLRCHCSRCSAQQGARIVNVKRRGRPTS